MLPIYILHFHQEKINKVPYEAYKVPYKAYKVPYEAYRVPDKRIKFLMKRIKFLMKRIKFLMKYVLKTAFSLDSIGINACEPFVLGLQKKDLEREER